MNTSPSKRLQQITQIAKSSVSVAQAYFKDRQTLAINHKTPSQAVTEADKEIEASIRNAMAKDFPGENIVGEEFGGQSNDSFWTIDPIDGTANFLNGLPFWGIAIGHVSDETPDLGIIILPELNTVVSADSQGLFLNGKRVERTPTLVPTVSLGQADDETLNESLEMHRKYRDSGFAVYHWRCSAVSLAWTALGQISGHIHQRTTLWDTVPGAALCQAAGLDVRVGTQQSNLWIKTGDAALHSVTKDCWEAAPEGDL